MIPVPKGFYFAALEAGFRYTQRKDLGLILSQYPAQASGVFTRNVFQAAPVVVARELLSTKKQMRGILVNSGQANACTGTKGILNCRKTLDLVAGQLNLDPSSVFPASTGVIGEQMPMQIWEKSIPCLVDRLGQDSAVDFAQAIMTTDAFNKIAWRTLHYAEHEICILGMAKGAGMICPNMATMLGFVCCDAGVESGLWQKMLDQAVQQSFNRITVDGDTSTNDCVLALANSATGLEFTEQDMSLQTALTEVCQELAYFIVQDAEGGTKVIHLSVQGAADSEDAEKACRAIAHSPLVKTALFGNDPNWGRIIAALGRSGANISPEHVSVQIAGITIFDSGMPVDIDVDKLLAPYLQRQDVHICIILGKGQGTYSMLASDLTHDYVQLNAAYRS